MPKKAPDQEGSLAGIHLEPRLTIPGVHKTPVEEIRIAGQPRRLLQAQQERQDVIVRHSLAMEVTRDRAKANAPLPQEIGLIPGDAFVQDVHAAAATSSAKCPARSNSARRASCTASVTASLVIFPSPQR